MLYKKKTMKITVLPVSGGGFVSQLALLSIVPCVNNIILGSSGGNLAAYIGLASDFKPHSMERILGSINSNMLLASWWPRLFDFMPSWVAGYSRGSYYASGSGVESMFQGLFTPNTITRKEIWTGTTMCKTSKSQIFCNRKRDSVLFNVSEFTMDEFNTMPLRYLDGNISDISAISLASASIPSFVPPVVFNGDDYVDGGATYASPMTPLSPILRSYDTLHIDYLNSFDVNSSTPLCRNNMTSLIKTTTTEMIHSMILQDRSNGIEIIRRGNKRINFLDFCCSREKLDDIYSFRENTERSFLEIYPDKYYCVEMDNYCYKTAKEILWLDRQNFRCRFWWIGDRVPESYAEISHV